MLEGEELSATLFKSWKKSFNNGIPIPTKKKDFVMNVLIKECVIGVIITLMKTKNSKLI